MYSVQPNSDIRPETMVSLSCSDVPILLSVLSNLSAISHGKELHVTPNPAVSTGFGHVCCSDLQESQTKNAAHAALLSEIPFLSGLRSIMNSRDITSMMGPWGNDGGIPSRSLVFRSLVGIS